MSGFLQGEDPGDAQPEPVPVEPSGLALRRRDEIRRQMQPVADAIFASFHREQRRQARARAERDARARGEAVPHPLTPAD